MADATMLSSWYDSYKKDNSAPEAQVTAAPQAQVTEWKPDTSATVQGQLNTMLKSGSPLMDRAATKAAQETNKRGLLNSSIGVSAGQSALYDAALPIAQADANTFAAAGKTNADAYNQASQQAAGFTQQANVQNAAAANELASQQRDIAARAGMQSEQIASQTALAQADNDNKVKLATMDADNKQALAKMEADYKTKLQTSQSVAASYQSMTDSITRIMMDPNLDSDAKKAAIENVRVLYANAMDMQSAVSGLNLGSIISGDSFGTIGGPSLSGSSGSSGSPSASQSAVNSTQGAGGPGGEGIGGPGIGSSDVGGVAGVAGGEGPGDNGAASVGDAGASGPGAGCYLTTAAVEYRGLPDDCHELQSLRAFRDRHMIAEHPEMVSDYYATAPRIVAAIKKRDDAGTIFKDMWDLFIVPSVAEIDAGNDRLAQDIYVACAVWSSCVAGPV